MSNSCKAISHCRIVSSRNCSSKSSHQKMSTRAEILQLIDDPLDMSNGQRSACL